MSYYESVKYKLDFKAAGFDYIFDYLSTIENPVIVETGSVNKIEDVFSGHSSILFDRFITERGGEFYTVDTSADACLTCSTNFSSANSYAYMGDSVSFLSDLNKSFISQNKKIDLLYLDSMEVSINNEKMSRRTARQHVYEFLTILPSLQVGCLICVADNWAESKQTLVLNHPQLTGSQEIVLRGSGGYLGEYMDLLNKEPCFVGYHMMWRHF